MVRYLAGTMMGVAKNKLSINEFKKILKNDSDSRNIFKAPACGLYLKKVSYD